MLPSKGDGSNHPRASAGALCGKLGVSVSGFTANFAQPHGFRLNPSLISDVRKWLDEKTEYFALPDLDAEPLYGVLPTLALKNKVA